MNPTSKIAEGLRNGMVIGATKERSAILDWLDSYCEGLNKEHTRTVRTIYRAIAAQEHIDETNQ